MGDVVTLVGIQVRVKTALVLHDALQFADDPVGEAKPINDTRLRLFLGRHFLQRNLRPNRFPNRSTRLVHRPQIFQRKIAFCRVIVVAIETMTLQKDTGEILKIPTDGFSGRVDFRSLSRRTEHGKDRHPKGERQLVHARTSLSGPVPESNLAAIFSDMLKRSISTPDARRMDVYSALIGRLLSNCVKQPVLNAPS